MWCIHPLVNAVSLWSISRKPPPHMLLKEQVMCVLPSAFFTCLRYVILFLLIQSTTPEELVDFQQLVLMKLWRKVRTLLRGYWRGAG
uniref:Uncharacterized protein n=1 Tax=Arundo donax TaxID=35708 RepID=A0A0A9CXP4_ARUDO